MKLINNNLKIIEKHKFSNYNESYIVENLNSEDTREKYILELLDGNTNQMLVKDYINFHIDYKNLSHKYILKTIDFKRIESINLKPVYGNKFYTLSEYTNWKKLGDIKNTLTIEDVATIFIKLFQTIDYLHFRNFTYNFLTPDNIFISKNYDIKISSIGKVIEYSFYKDKIIDNLKYLAPELFSGETNNKFENDYFSLGALLEDFMLPILDTNNLEVHNKINSMVKNLKQKNLELKQNKIKEYINEIIDIFEIDYSIDYKQERQKLHFDINPIGIDSYISQVLDIDNSMKQGIPNVNGIIITGNPGTGKARLLNEISDRVELLGRKVFRIQIDKSNVIKSERIKLFIISLLEAQHIEYKYLNDKSKIKILTEDSKIVYNFRSLDDNFKILNILAEGFISMSRINPVYISLSNLSSADFEIFSNLDFLISRIRKSNIVLLFTLDLETIKKDDLSNIINNWIEIDSFKELTLKNLNEENTINLITHIVGSENFPKIFSKLLYRESLGNIRYLNILLKHFHDINEIFINKIGEWEIKTKDYDNIYFPQTFGETINTTFDNLSKQELKVLEIISCFEYPASESIIIKIMNIKKQVYNDLVEGLLEKKILIKNNIENNNKLLFLEGELKRQIYNFISDKDKLDYHAKISQILLNGKSNGEDINFNSLIKQLSGANKLDTLYEVIQDKIENERFKNSDTIIIFLQLLFSKLDSKKHEKRLEVIEQIIQFYISIGKYEELDSYIDRLEEISKELKLENKVIVSKLYRFEAYVRTNNLFYAKQLSKNLRSIPQVKQNKEYLLEYIRIAALYLQALGKNVETISILEKAIAIAISLDYKSFLGDLYNLLGISYYFEGCHNKALDNYELAIKVFDYSPQPCNVVKPLSNIGSIYNEVYSQPSKALEYFIQSNNIAEKNNLLNGQSIFLNNIGEAYFNMADYDNAEIYFNKSIQISKLNKDRVMKYLSIVNLGFNNLNQRKLREAIQIFHSLRQMNKNKPILDAEINMIYTNFLGNLYMALGDLRLGKKFSQISVDKSKDVIVIEYMKASYRIFTIDSISKMNINREDLEDIIAEFKNQGNALDRANFILKIGFLALRLNDKNIFDYLYKEFQTIGNQNIREIYKDDIRILNNLVSNKTKELIETYDLLNNKDIRIFISKIRYLSQLGKQFYEKKLYTYSIRALLDSLDLFYKYIHKLGIDGYEEKLEDYYSMDQVKYLLKEVFINGLGKDVRINNKNFKSNYMDLRLYLDLLSNEDICRIYKKQEDEDKFKNLATLIESFDCNYINNINKLLEFISYHTMAENVEVRVFNYPDIGESTEYILNKTTKTSEISSVIINSVKEGESILINNSCASIKKSPYEEYLSEDKVAVIGIPIFETEKEISNNERRIENNKKDIYGCILASTTSGINMFNEENFKLIKSVSKLMYLNLENMKLFRQSNYDKLTGVLTRSSIEKRLDELTKDIETSSNFSVLMLDIDKFKNVNDTYGHQVGDRVLKSIGKILRDNLRKTDLVGRYGGEEFLLILDSINSDDSFNVAKKILKAIESYKAYGIKEKVTVSVGISKYPDHTVFKDELIFKADQALYYAKEVLGRNEVAIWNSEMKDIENLQSYVHSIAFGGFTSNANNVISLVDMSLMNRKEHNIESKIFTFLGLLIDGTEAEIASLLLVSNKEQNKQYNRQSGVDTWVDDVSINNELLRKSIKSNESFTFIQWHPNSLVENKSDNFNIKSLILSPLLVNGSLKGVVYLEVPLKRKEFTSENIGFVETLSGILCGNL